MSDLVLSFSIISSTAALACLYAKIAAPSFCLASSLRLAHFFLFLFLAVILRVTVLLARTSQRLYSEIHPEHTDNLIVSSPVPPPPLRTTPVTSDLWSRYAVQGILVECKTKDRRILFDKRCILF